MTPDMTPLQAADALDRVHAMDPIGAHGSVVDVLKRHAREAAARSGPLAERFEAELRKIDATDESEGGERLFVHKQGQPGAHAVTAANLAARLAALAETPAGGEASNDPNVPLSVTNARDAYDDVALLRAIAYGYRSHGGPVMHGTGSTVDQLERLADRLEAQRGGLYERVSARLGRLIDDFYRDASPVLDVLRHEAATEIASWLGDVPSRARELIGDELAVLREAVARQAMHAPVPVPTTVSVAQRLADAGLARRLDPLDESRAGGADVIPTDAGMAYVREEAPDGR